MPYFLIWILWSELRIYSQGGWFSDKFENAIHELIWEPNFNFENLSRKFIQISTFLQIFDIKIVLLG